MKFKIKDKLVIHKDGTFEGDLEIMEGDSNNSGVVIANTVVDDPIVTLPVEDPPKDQLDTIGGMVAFFKENFDTKGYNGVDDLEKVLTSWCVHLQTQIASQGVNWRDLNHAQKASITMTNLKLAFECGQISR